MSWLSARLDASHDLGRFDCGNDVLNRWLRDHALRADQQGTARTMVWADADGVVVAYYSIAPTEVLREGISHRAAGGHSIVPAYLLARLALDVTLRGQGLGTQLLLDAAEVIVAAHELSGGRLLVVDAIDEAAASFYRAHGFSRIQGTTRLYIKIASLAHLG